VCRVPLCAFVEAAAEPGRVAGRGRARARRPGPKGTDRARAQGAADVNLGGGAAGKEREQSDCNDRSSHARSMHLPRYTSQPHLDTSMRRAMRLAFLLCCAASVARAQDTELPLDRLTPAIVSQLVDSSIVSAARYRDSLLAVRGRRTVQNTLRLYDEISIRFNTAQIVHFLSRMHPDSAVRAAAAEGVRRRDAFSTSLDLDPRIYRALRAVDTTRADTETRYYLRRVLAQYHHDGVDRDSSTRARVAALRDEATRLAQRFTENLRQANA